MNKNSKSQSIGTIAIIGAIGVAFEILVNFTAILDWITNKLPKKDENKADTLQSSQSSLETQAETSIDESIQTAVTVEESATADNTYAVLCDLKVVESSGLWDVNNHAVDTLGNEYLGNIVKIGSGYSSNDSITYYLGKNYNTLTGVIAIADNSSNREEYNAQLFISCDKDVVYSTDVLGRETVPIEFSINVENCEWLKISKAGKGFNGSTTTFILYNWELIK